MYKKNGVIEIFRFLGIAFIMCDHFRQIGLKDLPRPFTGTWVYVEFFLILSGFLTAKHFYAKDTPNKISTFVSNGIIYTVKKYYKFIPYVILAVLTEYLVKYGSYLFNGDFLGFFKKFQEIPFEMFLLSAASTNGTLTFPIWFLSATFLVSPIICIISQVKNKYVMGMLSFYPALFYYLNRANGGIGNHDYPNQIIRALCGMLLGIIVFLASDYVKNRKFSKMTKSILSICQIILICVLLYINYKGLSGFISTYLICFIGIIMLSFSNQTYLPSCDKSFVLFLGKLSMPMFIWHWPVAHLLVLFIPEDQVALRIITYYIGTIIVSLVTMGVLHQFFKTRHDLKSS